MPDFSATEIALLPETRATGILLIIDILFNESEGKKCSQLKALVAVPSRLVACVIISSFIFLSIRHNAFMLLGIISHQYVASSNEVISH